MDIIFIIYKKMWERGCSQQLGIDFNYEGGEDHILCSQKLLLQWFTQTISPNITWIRYPSCVLFYAISTIITNS